MLPFKKILCPTDFSDSAFMALKMANELAQEYSAELLVVHVVSEIPVLPALPTNPTIDIPLYQEMLDDAAKTTLETLIKDKISPDISVKPIIVQGNAAHEIVEVAKKEGVDLLVISTHGETGFRHFIYGSVAEKVVRLSPCPVLTIHAGPKGE